MQPHRSSSSNLRIVGGADFSSPAYPLQRSSLDDRQQAVDAPSDAKVEDEPDQQMLEALAGEQLANEVAWAVGLVALTLLIIGLSAWLS